MGRIVLPIRPSRPSSVHSDSASVRLFNPNPKLSTRFNELPCPAIPTHHLIPLTPIPSPATLIPKLLITTLQTPISMIPRPSLPGPSNHGPPNLEKMASLQSVSGNTVSTMICAYTVVARVTWSIVAQNPKQEPDMLG